MRKNYISLFVFLQTVFLFSSDHFLLTLTRGVDTLRAEQRFYEVRLDALAATGTVDRAGCERKKMIFHTLKTSDPLHRYLYRVESKGALVALVGMNLEPKYNPLKVFTINLYASSLSSRSHGALQEAARECASTELGADHSIVILTTRNRARRSSQVDEVFSD